MNENWMLDAMSRVDPVLVEAADGKKAGGRRMWRRPLLIAACLCAALLVPALAGALGIQVGDFVTSEKGSGYRFYSDELKLWKVSELSREARSDAAEEAQYLSRGFDRWSDVREYLGIPLLENPLLDECETVSEFLGTEEERNFALMEKDERGDLLHATAVTDCVIDGIVAYVKASAFMEAGEYLVTDGVEEMLWDRWAMEFTTEEYTTQHGFQAQIVRADPAEAEGSPEYVGYFVQDGILYRCYICGVVAEGVEPDYLSVMHDVLDSFQ